MEIGRMPMAVVIRLVKAAGIGTPLRPVAIDVRDAIVVWQPDGEVKTLRGKP